MKGYSERRAWAQTATEGDYLAEFEGDGLTALEDPGSRCGYGDDELDEVERWLADRGLRLAANDRGLVVERIEGE